MNRPLSNLTLDVIRTSLTVPSLHRNCATCSRTVPSRVRSSSKNVGTLGVDVKVLAVAPEILLLRIAGHLQLFAVGVQDGAFCIGPQ